MAWASAKRLTAVALLGLVECAGPLPALAHPHVRISVELTFVVRNAALHAINQRWTFDAGFRTSSLEEFDKNGNGVLDPDEFEAFRQLSIATMKRFDNFTVVWHRKLKTQFTDAAFTGFNLSAQRPAIEFSIALVKPLPLNEPVLVDVYDPTYYSAFDFASAQSPTIDTDNAAECSAHLVAPAESSQQRNDYRAFVATFGPLAARLVTPRSITLSCAASLPTSSLTAKSGVGTK